MCFNCFNVYARIASHARQSKEKKENIMPGTRTAPAITGAQTYDTVTFRFIDENEKEYSDTFRIDAATTAVELEAVAAAVQLASNGSLYDVVRSSAWRGAKNAANALSAVHESVADKIRLSMVELSSGAYEQAYIPAPLETLVGDGGVVDITQVAYTTWRDAVLAAVPTTFVGLNTEFVQYSQRNDAVSP